MQVGIEALNQIAENTAQTRFDLKNGLSEGIKNLEDKIDNQKPAIVVNNPLILDGSGIAALANLPLNHPLVLAFAQQAALPLQITGAPSGANESVYVRSRQRKFSAISEEISSASTSRSNTPPTDYSDTGTPPSSPEKFISD
jgi:hypothetical protein